MAYIEFWKIFEMTAGVRIISPKTRFLWTLHHPPKSEAMLKRQPWGAAVERAALAALGRGARGFFPGQSTIWPG